MNIFDGLLRRFGYVRAGRRFRAGYQGANINRLTSAWPTTPTAADAELRTALRVLRSRSRDLTVNNDHARRFIKMVGAHVAGPSGVAFQNKAKRRDGSLDRRLNSRIEDAWSRWGRRGVCEVSGQFCWRDLQRHVVETVARDGEYLIRFVLAENDFGFSLQLIEADHLDETINRHLGGGRYIRMGVETNEWGRAVAYHLSVGHPGDTLSQQRYTTVRVPAEEILHLKVTDRVTQIRGVPWMHSSMTRLGNLGAYEEAEIVAARIAASKMGFFVEEGAEYAADATDASGNLISEVEPGMFEKLPAGVKFEAFDPQHPSGNFEPFIKSTLRSIASGLNVSYNSLTSDLEATSYSSIRAGLLEERDAWRVLQNWFIDSFCQPVFDSWLPRAVLTQDDLRPYATTMRAINAPSWKPRAWSWVDPLKDAQAQILALEAGLVTRTELAAEQGRDFEELCEEAAREREIMQEYGIEFSTPGQQQAEAQEEQQEAKRGNGNGQ